jgi:hypothetical protein
LNDSTHHSGKERSDSEVAESSGGANRSSSETVQMKIEENVEDNDTVNSFVKVPGNMNDESPQEMDINRHQTESQAAADIDLEGRDI